MASRARRRARGANCATAPIANAPASTTGDWSRATAVYNAVGYGICTLTYDLAFDDHAVVYCTSDAEQRKARTVKDYLTKAVLSTQGQAGTGGAVSGLPGADYDALPAAILDIAKAGVAEIGWNKGGQGRPCSTQQPATGAGSDPDADPGAGRRHHPAAASAAAVGPQQRRHRLLVACQRHHDPPRAAAPGRGQARASRPRPSPRRARRSSSRPRTSPWPASGAQTLSIALSSKAKSALRKDKRLKVTLKITYTPTGGTARTITRTVTVKQPKKK